MKKAMCILLTILLVIIPILVSANIAFLKMKKNDQYKVVKHSPHGGVTYKLKTLQLITPKDMVIEHITMEKRNNKMFKKIIRHK